jgi:hypothetical protein
MSPLLLAALILVVWELAGRRLPWPAERAWPRIPEWAALPAAVVLVGGFWAGLALLGFQSGHDGTRAAWFANFPLRFVDDAYPFGDLHAVISLGALALALLETLALGTLVAIVAQQPGRSWATRVAPLVFAALAVLAVSATVVSSGDLFGYVGLGMLRGQAYFRPVGFFTGEYARVFAHYPIRPTIYGPFWVWFNAAIVALGGPGFLGKMVALRLAGVLELLLLIALGRALALPRAALYALALNPMLWLQFVVNAHNDLAAVVLLVAASLLVGRRWPAWASVAIACAGLIKFPFLLLGVVAFVRLPLRARLGYAALAVGLCVAASAAFGGHPYLDALLGTARSRGAAWDPLVGGVKAACALGVLAVCAFALLRGRLVAFGGWLFPALAPVLFPWYFVWTVPYGVAAGNGLTASLLALPLAATLADTIYGLDPIALVVPAGIVGALLLGMRPGLRYLRA